MYHVILAGGSGSRFWPKSRKDAPKQLLKILGDETMIRMTYNRLLKIADVDKILIVASKELSKLIHNDISDNRFILFSKIMKTNQVIAQEFTDKHKEKNFKSCF